MNGLWLVPPARLALVLCSAAGLLVGLATVATARAIVAARDDAAGSPSLEATHLPPLLTMPGESVRLEYEAFCVGVETAGSEVCDVSGTAFVRSQPGQDFARIRLEPVSSVEGRRLVADVPEGIAASASGFEYYAVLEESSGQASVTVPSAGAAAPHRSARLGRGAVDVDLGRHVFGRTRDADERVANVAWGTGPADAGLEGGRTMSPIGASAFAVDRAGAVYLLDQVKRRVLRWGEGARVPVRTPVSVTGTLADLAVASDGSLYVLETAGAGSALPLVRRFDFAGRELERVVTAEPMASQIRMSADGPVVLQQPSHHWMPMSVAGSPASTQAQLRNGQVGRPLLAGGDVVAFRTGSEIRVALTSRGGVRRSWRVRSETALGEVQLVEPLGDRLVLVVRAYTDNEAEFVVLTLGRRGVVSRMSLASADWAETAPLGRFELAGSSLYQLGSSPYGAFVDRFDLEVS